MAAFVMMFERFAVSVGSILFRVGQAADGCPCQKYEHAVVAMEYPKNMVQPFQGLLGVMVMV